MFQIKREIHCISGPQAVHVNEYVTGVCLKCLCSSRALPISVFQQESLKPVKGLMDPSISDAEESFNHDQTGEKREQINTIIEQRVLDIKKYEVHISIFTLRERESY